MCGIVGAISKRNVAHILLAGLKRLEYRGYDSAGIAIVDAKDKKIHRLRVKGKVEKLEKALEKHPLLGYEGIAHTRWATHGEPNEKNAHPHFSKNDIAVVHNGIIENYESIRDKLINQGYEFLSDTDTEVIAHLIHYYLDQKNDTLQSIKLACHDLEGAFALGIIDKNNPEKLFAVRSGSPLVIGLGIDEKFIASDSLALMGITQEFIFLDEGDIAELSKEKIAIFNNDLIPVNRPIQKLDSQGTHTIEKGEHRHFMLKEILEQPHSLANTLEGHFLKNRMLEQTFGHKAVELLTRIKHIHIIACGTSYHAGLVARDWFESLTQIPCQVEVASENRYRHAVIEPDTLFLAISQSGETADTLAALRQAKEKNYFATLGICNVAHSSLVREADLTILTRAGSEIGVAATKTFTAQLAALLMLALLLAQKKSLLQDSIEKYIHALSELPQLIEKTLLIEKEIKNIARQFIDKQHALFIGRGALYPIAMEGALKLKEISYIHAEAYPAGELKHGPLALVDENMPVIVLAPKNGLIDKLHSNVQEIQARGGQITVFSDDGLKWNNNNHHLPVQTIHMPSTIDILAPIVYTIPMQLLAYHVAILKGTDVDQPRNLAKSVTVE